MYTAVTHTLCHIKVTAFDEAVMKGPTENLLQSLFYERSVKTGEKTELANTKIASFSVKIQDMF